MEPRKPAHEHRPRLPVHHGGLRQPLRPRPLSQAGQGAALRRDGRRLRADGHASSCRSSTRGRPSSTPSRASSRSTTRPTSSSVTVVDDCSTDDSYAWALRAADAPSRSRPRAAEPAQHGQAHGHQPRRARERRRDHRLRRQRRDRRPQRRARAGRALLGARHRRRRWARPRVEPQRQLADAHADHQILLRAGAAQEPRALDALGDVPVGLSDRLSPPRARRARADPREPQRLRRAHQVRRRSLPHASNRQGRLSHADDDGRVLLTPRRRRR